MSCTECTPDAFRRPVRGLVWVAAAAAVFGVSCSSGGGSVSRDQTSASTTGDAKGIATVDAAYARAEQSVRAGGVYHATIETKTTTTRSYLDRSNTTERWVDVVHGVARDERTVPDTGPENASGQFITMITGDVAWVQQPVGPGQPVTQGQPQDAQTCFGLSPAAALVIGCPPFGLFKGSTTLSKGSYAGRPALVLAIEGTISGEDHDVRYTSKTYLDPVTALPVGKTEDGSFDVSPGTTATYANQVTYRYAFAKPESLQRGFFDPATLGWHAPDPVAALPTGVPVYWLGQDFDPGGGLPKLTLATVTGPQNSNGGYTAILDYAPVTDRYGPRVISIQLLTTTAPTPATPGCPGQTPIVINAAQVTLYCGVAIVRFPNAVLQVVVGGGDGPAIPYNTPQALVTVIRGLRLRTP